MGPVHPVSSHCWVRHTNQHPKRTGKTYLNTFLDLANQNTGKYRTFGPMGSMFNIMAIAIDWRVIVEPSSQEAEGGHIDDPRWLVAVNALSLAVAIVANLALLLQMGNRVRFNIASPISIAGWFISGIIDLALVSIAPSQLPLPTDVVATFSQAYYYCIFAGSIYVLLSIMLAMTAWGVWIGNYGSEFKLTMSQRSLMLQTILFLTYVLSAGAVYSRVEGWVYLDSCYYVVSICATTIVKT